MDYITINYTQKSAYVVGYTLHQQFNSLTTGRFEWDLDWEVLCSFQGGNDGWGIPSEIALMWLPHDLTDDGATLVQIMAWCRQASSHYLSQCWPRSMSPYGVTRPQWIHSLDPVCDVADIWKIRFLKLITQNSSLGQWKYSRVPVNATGSDQWEVNIASDNRLVPSGPADIGGIRVTCNIIGWYSNCRVLKCMHFGLGIYATFGLFLPLGTWMDAFWSGTKWRPWTPKPSP